MGVDIERAEIAQPDRIGAASSSRNGRGLRSWFAKWSLKCKAIAIVVLVAVAVLIVEVAVPACAASSNKGKTISEADLKRVVNIDRLSTAEVKFEGIAEKRDENQEPLYYVCYVATVSAGVDMGDIDFDVDEEKKTVMPLLPEITLGDPVLQIESLDLMKMTRWFFFPVPDPSQQEEIELCKEDARTSAGENGYLVTTAEENLRKIIESLTKPLLDDAGYTITWPEDMAIHEGADGEDAESVGGVIADVGYQGSGDEGENPIAENGAEVEEGQE